ncbi:MAG: hypothetical protein ACOYW4_01750 [Bacillota bacterium]
MLILEQAEKLYTTREQKAFYEDMKARKVFDRYVDLFSLAAAIGLREHQRLDLGSGREELFNVPTMPGDLQFAFSLLLDQRHRGEAAPRANILLSEYAAAGIQHLQERWQENSTLGILRDLYRLVG